MTPIQKVAGIGQALEALLAAKGISTAEQLTRTSPETLRSIPRFGAQRASALLAAAQKLVAGPDSEATATPLASTEARSPIHDHAPARQVKSDKKQTKSDKIAGAKAASAKSAKKAAKLEKDAKKAEKAAAEKTAKKVSAKAAEPASEKKAAKAPRADGKSTSKAILDKPAKAKMKAPSKKK